MSDYTPTTASVRIAYVFIDEHDRSARKLREEAFDRWLVEHDAALVAERDRLSESLHMMMQDRDAARAEAAAAQAVIKAALEAARPGQSVPLGQSEWRHADSLLIETHRILASASTGALDERDAEKWQEGADAAVEVRIAGAGYVARAVQPPPVNPYRDAPTEEPRT